MLRVFFSLPLIIFLFFSCNYNKKTSYDGVSEENSLSTDINTLILKGVSGAEEYSQVLDFLDQSELKSLDIAVKILQNSNTDTLTHDSMLVRFSDFLSVVANSYLENNDTLHKIKSDISEITLQKISKRLSEYGMMLSAVEGEYFLESDQKYILKNFGDKISAGFRDYLVLSIKEQQGRQTEAQEDSIAVRIMEWENFLVKYPDFISISQARDYYAQNVETFLVGTENDQRFDMDSGSYSEKAKTALENFIGKYSSGESLILIMDYYDLLKSSGFRYSAKIDSFILARVYPE